MKKKNLVWNVFSGNYNTKQIEVENIFEHDGFMEDVKKALKETDKNVFEEKLRQSLSYYFWGKCEYEVVITSWPPYIDREDIESMQCEIEENEKRYGTKPLRLNPRLTVEKKIDIYEQVRLNWDVFADYVWSQKGK